MPNPLLIVKNFEHEGPGLFREVLDEHRVPYSIIDLDAGDQWPPYDSISGLLVMGGPDSANDTGLKMTKELAYISEALARNLPYLGICLGLQTLVKAMGGSVRKNEVREIGCMDPDGQPFAVEFTEEGKRDPLLAGLSSPLPIFHLHGETVDLTPSMAVLATGKWCGNQIVRVADRAYGIQGHWDVTDDVIRTWHDVMPEFEGRDWDDLRMDWEEIRESSLRSGRAVFRNFLRIAGLRKDS